MNSEASQLAERTSTGRLIDRLAQRLRDPEFSMGDHAALRRLSADGRDLRHAVPLYRLMEDVGISASTADGVRRWAAIINALVSES
jgi:hypothetical protein